MKKFFLLLFIFLVIQTGKSNAQNWTVGVPVDMSISYLTKYAFSCAPQPDFNMNIMLNSVSGIQYLAIVDSVQDIAVIPFVNDTLMQGDTLFLSQGNNVYAVSFVNGTGNISFNFKAVGTPTTAGESHPCLFSDTWMSNFLLCNEGLTKEVQNLCFVDAATALDKNIDENVEMQFPSYGNQFHLQLNNLKNTNEIFIYDISGKQLISKINKYSSAITISCQELSSGIYFLKLKQDKSNNIHKFIIQK
jgi:hypothetical protein